jgi:hypothetical protein
MLCWLIRTDYEGGRVMIKSGSKRSGDVRFWRYSRHGGLMSTGPNPAQFFANHIEIAAVKNRSGHGGRILKIDRSRLFHHLAGRVRRPPTE